MSREPFHKRLASWVESMPAEGVTRKQIMAAERLRVPHKTLQNWLPQKGTGLPRTVCQLDGLVMLAIDLLDERDAAKKKS